MTKVRALQKSQFSNILVNWEIFGSAPKSFQKSQSTIFINWEKFGSIRSPKPTFQNPNFESMDELGKNIYVLSFTVENKMGNLHKKGWSHFKLNIND